MTSRIVRRVEELVVGVERERLVAALSVPLAWLMLAARDGGADVLEADAARGERAPDRPGRARRNAAVRR